MMPNGLNVMSAIYGIALAGAVVVPINLRYRAVELPFVVENGDLVAILTSDEADGYVDLPGLLGEALPGLAEASDPRALEISAAPRLRSVVVLGARRAPGTVGADAFARGAAQTSEAELHRRRAGTRLRSTRARAVHVGHDRAPARLRAHPRGDRALLDRGRSGVRARTG